MSFKTNKVNRNFTVKNHIYFNKDSYNRSGDVTPRYFVKSVELLNVEKVGFSYKSILTEKGYQKRGHRFYGYVKDDTLTDEEILSNYETLKNSYPYGFISGDTASETKYRIDVKENPAFQSFYKSYWDAHSDQVKIPQKTTKGDLDYPYPYIEYTGHEIVKIKHNSGTVPVLQMGDDGYNAPYAEFPTGINHFVAPYAYSCYKEDIYVNAHDYYSENRQVFLMDGGAQMPLVLHNNSGTTYTFHLVSGRQFGYGTNLWPTGSDGLHSGIALEFSTGLDGTWGGYSKYDNVSAYDAAELHNYYVSSELKDGDPETGHPYYNSGSVSGYVISGQSRQSGPITAYRGHTYVFHVTGSSNVFNGGRTGDPSGLYDVQDLIVTSEEVWGEYGVHSQVDNPELLNPHGTAYGVAVSGEGAGTYTITIPWEAPDTLYYQSRNSAYYGGVIDVSNPPTATGNKPGQFIRVSFTGEKDERMYYYSPSQSGMGGLLILKSDCDGKALSV
tara:strand:+ start:27321 stop:28817 length:1497 start_codon:yes stop_codon:yes gene_type:complete